MLFQLVSVLALVATATATPVHRSRSLSFDRFFTIILENTNYDEAMADDYLGSTLASKGRILTNLYALTHPSQPNYLAMISGDTQGNRNDKRFSSSSPTIVDVLEQGGVSWGVYQQGYTGRCNTAMSIGRYVRKHNPFISFTGISQNPRRCAKIVPATSLNRDIRSNRVPSYVFYTPDMYNDGHDTGVSYASNWLQDFLEPLLVNPVFANTVFFVTFDEDSNSDNQIYGVLLGGPVAAGTTDNAQYDHYSQMATVEANWGLGNLGQADASASAFTLA
ncbi:hypothetical protein BASA50_008347 [Batrachochytrium salamandrivorans]|uniref:Acid phosphatase n=1 Tax=Batrachochytrium salamandrivorans TaxID=1357716 RepID=A0ABQ8F794_9FUNG|nr:hypothetical protein BASA60_009470 [Batrachochytrium salamandrivorans]KAH6575584.1 hypothetical protein BASA62_001836 [Batrachochytrium salamandrivorans]KAH6590114.1 hypothetical protein BASA61_005407 [Batrachochytrium salamandrivorans]KAH6591947.1 hypothetical protein BASA50_008347 [Batrachochytrium salamandrivorans]KAH9252388.1 hypothetical protein BASA81_009673 [Batrachochytrium salamandrivorans]